MKRKYPQVENMTVEYVPPDKRGGYAVVSLASGNEHCRHRALSAATRCARSACASRYSFEVKAGLVEASK